MAFRKPIERSERERAAYADWLKHPNDAIKDWFKVTPDDWQGDVLQALFTGTSDRVAMKAAHGPGKTAVDAMAGWIFLNCYEDCRVVATAPTMSQLNDVLFPEFAKWANRFPQRMKDEWSISAQHIRHKLNAKDWFAVARTSNQPANLQGFHGTHLLILGDEASAIKKPVFEVIEGALSEAGTNGKVAKLLMGGNPNFNSGELHDAFYRNREMYDRVTITGDSDLLNSLGVEQGGYHPEHGRVYYSPRVSKKYVANIIKKYGADSAVFDVRVCGIFPRTSDDAIFPLEWVERAAARGLPTFDSVADGFSVVVDPSRGGAAETAVGVFRRGFLVSVSGHKVTSTTQIADIVHATILVEQKKGLRLDEIIVDQPGVGGGVIDILRRYFNYAVRGYDGGKPLVKGVDPDDDCKMFKNRRARDHWSLRRKLEQELIPIPSDEVLKAQMASIKFFYGDTDEKIQVESKQDMKDRLGDEASPDRSDVLVMGSAPYYAEDVTTVHLTLDDIIEGSDRETTMYREEMDAGIV